MKLNKLLGQHLLINSSILEYMCNYFNLSNKTVMEIGPGSGNLTKYIAKYTNKLILIEQDRRWSVDLELYNVVWGDCLQQNYDMAEVIMGNLPYNISQKFILMLLEKNIHVPMIFMVQKEVGEKFISHTYCGLLASINFQCNILKTIGPNNFIPKPKVDSVIISFTPIANYLVHKIKNIAKVLTQNPKRKLKHKWEKFSEQRITEIPLEIIRNYLIEA